MDRKDTVIGGGFLAAAGIFFFKKALAWALGQVLTLLPVPRNADGTPNMSALPWSNILGAVLLCTGLFFLWRARRAPSPTAAESPLYDDSGIRAALAEFKSETRTAVEALSATVSDLGDRITSVSGQMNELAKDAKPAIQKYRRDRAEEIVSLMAPGIRARPEPKDREKRRLMRPPAHQVRDLEEMFAEFGISPEEMSRVRDEARAEAERQVINCTLQKGEEDIWEAGADKLQWHVNNAMWQGLINLIRARSRYDG